MTGSFISIEGAASATLDKAIVETEKARKGAAEALVAYLDGATIESREDIDRLGEFLAEIRKYDGLLNSLENLRDCRGIWSD